MKTENTPEEKAKFFAQYWGQFLKTSDNHKTKGLKPLEIDSHSIQYVDEHSFLELTPLKNISDEDAIEVGYILLKRGRDYKKDIFCKQDAYAWIRNGMMPTLNPSQCVLAIDFIRSKSYLLPYKDLSTEDLIAYGWAKEIES